MLIALFESKDFWLYKLLTLSGLMAIILCGIALIRLFFTIDDEITFSIEINKETFYSLYFKLGGI